MRFYFSPSPKSVAKRQEAIVKERAKLKAKELQKGQQKAARSRNSGPRLRGDQFSASFALAIISQLNKVGAEFNSEVVQFGGLGTFISGSDQNGLLEPMPRDEPVEVQVTLAEAGKITGVLTVTTVCTGTQMSYRVHGLLEALGSLDASGLPRMNEIDRSVSFEIPAKALALDGTFVGWD